MGGRRFIIMQLMVSYFVVARDIETDDLVRLAVADLNPVSLAPSTVPYAILRSTERSM